MAQGRPSRLDRGDFWLGLALLTPSALLLGLVVIYPVTDLIRTSFYELKLSEGIAAPRFIGLANYWKALADPQVREAARTTLVLIALTVPGALVAGLGLAVLANKILGARWLIRLALLMPWMLPLVFTALLFRWFFDYKLGLVNDIAQRLGLAPMQWLSSPALAMTAITIAIIWKSSSFVAMVLLAGLQSIPKSLYEAAEVDGASRLHQFRYVTLPMLLPSIVVALVFRTITAIQTFDIPYAMTGGGPGNSTETIAMLIQKTTIDFLDFGYGSALATLMFVVSLAATSFYLKYVQREAPEG